MTRQRIIRTRIICVLRLHGKLILPFGNVGWCNEMMNSLLCDVTAICEGKGKDINFLF